MGVYLNSVRDFDQDTVGDSWCQSIEEWDMRELHKGQF